MKKTSILILLSILFLNTTAFGELTQTDLEKIDGLIKASETRMKEYVDLKIDALYQINVIYLFPTVGAVS